MNLCQPNTIRELMQRAGIRFRKEYGQNFLIDPDVPAGIADGCADSPDTLILEVGPGIGSLTAELAARYQRVLAVEIDRGLIPVLAETLSDCHNVTVLNADVMKLDLPTVLQEWAGDRRIGIDVPVAVCANLPYYITTPILMRLLECGVPFSSLTVMVQKEVADRLLAAPGTADYGAITAVLGYYGRVRRLFSVSRGAFMPAPNVDSAVVRVDLYPETPFPVNDRSLFFRILHGAFEQRRKTLVNALNAKCPEFSKQEITAAIVACGFPDTIRGERLSTADFAELSNRLAAGNS